MYGLGALALDPSALASKIFRNTLLILRVFVSPHTSAGLVSSPQILLHLICSIHSPHINPFTVSLVLSVPTVNEIARSALQSRCRHYVCRNRLNKGRYVSSKLKSRTRTSGAQGPQGIARFPTSTEIRLECRPVLQSLSILQRLSGCVPSQHQ